MATTYSGRAIPGMAKISVEDAVAYINNEQEQLALLTSNTTIASWIVPAYASEGNRTKKAKFRQTTWEDGAALGTYDNVKGYPDLGYASKWVEKDLTQEKGNVLTIDNLNNEASKGNDIVFLHNKYTKEIKIPAIEKYTYSKVTAGTPTNTTALTKENVLKIILTELTALKEANSTLQADAFELRLSPTTYQLLVELGYDKGSFTLGGQVFSFGADVNNIAGFTKIIVVPQAYLGAGVGFIISLKLAVNVPFLLDETVYRDSVPGHGTRKSQVEEGIFYDAFVVPGMEKYIRFNKAAA